MEVASNTSTLWSHDGGSIAFITYFDDEEAQLQGFECENIWLNEDEINDAKSITMTEDLDHCNTMGHREEKRSSSSLGHRWKKFIRAIRPSRNRLSSSKNEGNILDKSCDNSTVATSTSSLHSRRSLEGLLITTSTELGDEGVAELDPRILDFFSRIARATSNMPYDLQMMKPRIVTIHDLHFDDATACTEKSEASSVSDASIGTGNTPSLIEQRLLDTGVVKREDFSFVPDYVSKEVLHLVDERKEEGQYDPRKDEGVSHVKTGIWEITCFDESGKPKDPYYIVTGVSMNDRVDTKKLRKIIFAGEHHKRRPKVVMAPTEKAEALAGFQSGTMAPICHTMSMKLFMEESLVQNVDLNAHHLNVGSGRFGECLCISAYHLLEIAKSNSKGLELCPIIRKAM